eukprot:1946486-Pyramimonas_sp.AAC.1
MTPLSSLASPLRFSSHPLPLFPCTSHAHGGGPPRREQPDPRNVPRMARRGALGQDLVHAQTGGP